MIFFYDLISKSIKNFSGHQKSLTGETQLRARRTRIKILRAIADKDGVAGFSDIKLSTGLSTGSIYYHLERMGNYVTKNSKYYVITEEGLQLLREVDPNMLMLLHLKEPRTMCSQKTLVPQKKPSGERGIGVCVNMHSWV